jgi:hypothetical protein
MTEEDMNKAYIQGKFEAIKKAKSDEEIKEILDKIWEDGFSDGANEGHEAEPPEPLPWHELD